LFAWFFFYRMKSIFSNALPIAVTVGGLVSVTLFAWLYRDHQPAAFFLMPTRLWELGIGVLVFLAWRRGQLDWLQGILRHLAPIALIALILVFFIPEHHAMPATVAAVGLTGILLAADDRTLAWRLLVLPPVVYVGRISYSLYLWHWPIIALGPIVLASEWRSSGLYVVVMAIAAVFSFHWVEKPLRYRNWTRTRARDIGLGIACNLVLGAGLFFTMIETDVDSRSATAVLHPPPYLPVIPNGLKHESTCMIGAGRPLKPDTMENCTIPPRPDSGMPSIWGVGDSHVRHLQGLLYELHARTGVGVHLVETPGWSYPFQGDGEFEPRKQIFRQISERMEPGDIVLVSRIYLSRTPPHSVNDLRPWLPRLAMLAMELAEKDVHLVVTGPPPIFGYDDIRECSLEEREACRMERSRLAPQVAQVMELLTYLEQNNPNMMVFDLFETLCPSDSEYCYPDNGHSYLYRDKDHLNSLGARLLIEPFVDRLRYSGALEPAQ
jgi:hypothetical protein